MTSLNGTIPYCGLLEVPWLWLLLLLLLEKPGPDKLIFSKVNENLFCLYFF